MEQLFQDINGELLYNAAALLSLSAYLMTNVFSLRILLVAASTLYVITGLLLDITSMSIWNFSYLLINLFHIGLLLVNKSTIFLDDKIKGLYLGSFSSLTSREFKKLISVNPFRTLNDKQKIIEEGENTNELLVILNGKANIIKSGKVIAQLERGDLIGEMSFIGHQPASADVVTDNDSNNDTIVAYWTHQDLKTLKKKNSELYNKFIAIIGCDLVKKLDKSNQLIYINS